MMHDAPLTKFSIDCYGITQCYTIDTVLLHLTPLTNRILGCSLVFQPSQLLHKLELLFDYTISETHKN